MPPDPEDPETPPPPMSGRESLPPAASDLEAVARFRKGLLRSAREVRRIARSRGAGALALGASDRERLSSAWRSFLDYLLGLDSLARAHEGARGLSGRAAEGDSLLVECGAFMAQYRFALELLDAADRIPAADAVLNDAAPEAGLERGVYDAFKLRFLNVNRAAEFAWYQGALRLLGGRGGPATRRQIRADTAALLSLGAGRGEALTAKNVLDIVKKAGLSAWFPVQQGVSEWMGTVKLHREGRTLITLEQIARLAPLLRPGDILLQRREWYLSNVGLPGFWCHAALYVGTPEERRRYFDDPGAREWAMAEGGAGGDAEALIAAKCPEAHAKSAAPVEEDRPPRVLEAIRPGVVFTSLERSAKADSLAALRPRVPRREKARALLTAFRYAGRPYDFDFDFRTDSALVCSELVYKAYEPREGFAGLNLPLTEVVGRPVCSPNDIARLFAEEAAAGRSQLDLVAFLDGREAAGRAEEAGEAEFAESWKRPKWHVLADAAPGRPPQPPRGEW